MSGKLDELWSVADEARRVMYTVHHGYREDIDFQPLSDALEAVFGANYSEDTVSNYSEVTTSDGSASSG